MLEIIKSHLVIICSVLGAILTIIAGAIGQYNTNKFQTDNRESQQKLKEANAKLESILLAKDGYLEASLLYSKGDTFGISITPYSEYQINDIEITIRDVFPPRTRTTIEVAKSPKIKVMHNFRQFVSLQIDYIQPNKPIIIANFNAKDYPKGDVCFEIRMTASNWNIQHVLAHIDFIENPDNENLLSRIKKDGLVVGEYHVGKKFPRLDDGSPDMNWIGGPYLVNW